MHVSNRIAAFSGLFAAAFAVFVPQCPAGVIADYRDDFQGTTPATGWQYLWNAPTDWDGTSCTNGSTGPITSTADYEPLAWSGSFWTADGDGDAGNGSPARYLRLHGTGGHPGRGSTQTEAPPLDVANSHDRCTIAAYTIQAADAGPVYIVDSTCTVSGHGVAQTVKILVYVNGTLKHSVTQTGTLAATFDCALGNLSAGDTVYVALSPDQQDGSDGFVWDFTLSDEPVSANGPILIADFIDDYHSGAGVGDPADFADGWSYQWNAPTDWDGTSSSDGSTGPITTLSDYELLKWSGTRWRPDGDDVFSNGQPANYMNIGNGDGHPGRGSMQGEAPPLAVSNSQPRNCIYAFEVSTDGYYLLTDTLLNTYDGIGDGNTVRVYTSRDAANPIVDVVFDGVTDGSFDTPIGQLEAGDTIFVAVGPGLHDGNDNFIVDFTVIAGTAPRRLQVRFDGYTGTEVLTNFPVLVNLGAHLGGFSYDGFYSPAGDDLRFVAADGTAVVNHEVEKWDRGGTSAVWVQIPEFTNNTTVWAYWGGAWTGSVPAYATNGAVWSQDYVGVYHLSELGSPTTYADSSPENNDLTCIAAPAAGTGLAGGARTFTYNNVNQPLGNAAASGGMTAGEMTMAVWSKTTSAGNWRNPCGVELGAGNDLRLEFDALTPRRLNLYVGGAVAGANAIDNADDPAEGGDWKLLVFTASAGANSAQLYIDGIADSTPRNWSASAAATGLKVGAAWAGGHTAALGGTLDEARFSKVVRSVDWIQACYQYQGPNSGDYAEYSSAAAPAVVAPTIANTGTTDGLSSATVQGTLTAGTWADVTLYYGEIDGGGGGWEYTNVVSGLYSSNDVVSVELSGLKAGTQYHYAFRAANSEGSSLAQPSGTFSTEGADAWAWRTEISFDGYAGTTPLTNFPALVRLGAHIPDFDFSGFMSNDGADLRFTDSSGDIALPYEIDVWNTTAVSYVWVRVPVLTSTTKIWAYWGNVNATEAPDYTTDGSVWSADYVGVYHFSESGTPATFDDSSPYDNDVWAPLSSSTETGFIGGARGFTANNSTQPVRILSPRGGLNIDDFSLSLWAVTANGAHWRNWCGIEVGAGNHLRLELDADTPQGHLNLFFTGIPGGSSIGDPDDTIEDGAWHVLGLTGSSAANASRLYVDGAQDGGTGTWAASGAASGLKVGASWAGAYINSVGTTIDEARFSKVARSDDWMQAENDTQAQNGTFTTYGSMSRVNLTGTLFIVR
jgi:hypothetical protein